MWTQTSYIEKYYFFKIWKRLFRQCICPKVFNKFYFTYFDKGLRTKSRKNGPWRKWLNLKYIVLFEKTFVQKVQYIIQIQLFSPGPIFTQFSAGSFLSQHIILLKFNNFQLLFSFFKSEQLYCHIDLITICLKTRLCIILNKLSILSKSVKKSGSKFKLQISQKHFYSSNCGISLTLLLSKSVFNKKMNQIILELIFFWKALIFFYIL